MRVDSNLQLFYSFFGYQIFSGIVLSIIFRYQPQGTCPECRQSPKQRSSQRDNQVGPAQCWFHWLAEEAGAGSATADGAPGGWGPAGRTTEAGRDGEGGMGTCWQPDRVAAGEHWQSEGRIEIFVKGFAKNSIGIHLPLYWDALALNL